MCLIVVLFVLALLFAGAVTVSILGTFIVFLPWILVGLLAGAIAGAVTNSRHGILGDILIGLAGSFVGAALVAIFLHQRVPAGPFSLERIVAAIVGAILLLLVVKALRGPAAY